jgi:hypothetical protein
VLVCAAVHAAAGGYLAAPQTFWRSDNAVRFVQLESVRRNGYRNLAGGTLRGRGGGGPGGPEDPGDGVVALRAVVALALLR